MNNYNDFEVKDFLEDFGFQNWVYRGESDQSWRTYLTNNPFQLENVEQAKSILLSVRGDLDSISQEEVKSRVSELLDSISEEDKAMRKLWWKGKWLQIAAVLLLASGLGTYHYWGKLFNESQPYYAMTGQLDEGNMKEVINDTETIKLVNLPDGSSVVLKKNARICYPIKFAVDRREVYLMGEAFFEVEKNPDQPFYVFAGEMISKVTGTSFSIQANETGEEVKLVVKTGLVEISALNHNAKSIADRREERVVVSPNQLMTLNRKSLAMVTKKLERPVLIDLPIESLDFSFKRMPLKTVFESFTQAYGVQINFDEIITEECTITAKLGDEPVYEKLGMICSVVNATYEFKDGIVFIHSRGCKN